MPRTINHDFSHHWINVSINDILRLEEHKASGLTCRVWMILKSYCWGDKTTCFPSLKAIADKMGYTGKNFQRTIGRCLKWLRDHDFIVQKHKQSKERFTLIERTNRTKQSSETGPDSPQKSQSETNEITPIIPLTENNRVPSNKRKSSTRKRRARKMNPTSIRIASERKQELQRMEEERKQTDTFTERRESVFKEMKQLSSMPIPENQTARNRRFYSQAALYWLKLRDEEPDTRGIDKNEFLTWWMRDGGDLTETTTTGPDQGKWLVGLL